MPRAVLLALVVIAAVFIVFGRVNRRQRYGNWIALAGYGALALAAVLALTTRG